MSLALNNRLDIVILSTEEKPTVNLKNGSTLYEVDTAKLYVWYEGSWYDEEGAEVTEGQNQQSSAPVVKTVQLKDETSEDVVEDVNK